MKIWALHGFLGQISDFSGLQIQCKVQDPLLEWQSVDYMHSRELSPQTPLNQWGEAFCKVVKKDTDSKPVLLGYSQGGRLALQALKAAPHFWAGAILLSTNPGLQPNERSARQKNDEEWAEQFLNQNFQKTVDKWNTQSVFQGSIREPERKEADFNRHQLADCLTNWSLSQQEDFRSFLKSIAIPILYLSGEKDAKYVHIGSSLAASNSKITARTVAGAGHRVFMDQPAAVSGEVTRFTQSLRTS